MFFQNLPSFTCIMSSTCYPSNNIKCICDSDEKFTVCRNEHRNYLIANEYKPKVVEKHFSKIAKLSRPEAR